MTVDPAGADTPAAAAEPVILLERSGVTAIAKPAGLPTQAPPGIASLERWLRARLAPGAYLGIPHRLDRAVSGVILLATTPRAARKVSRQFERREVGKTYVAIVAPAAGAASWSDPEPREWIDRLAKVPGEALARVVGVDDPLGREARSTARLMGRLADDGAPPQSRLLLELHPHSGRMHQLRLQAASRGYPVVGDTLYGGPANAPADRRAPIALHALAIRFHDPDGAEAIAVAAPLPEAWPAAARALVARAAAPHNA